jgi:hypothetical protein
MVTLKLGGVGAGPVPVANVAVTVSGPAGILNVHVVVPTVHAGGAPLHPLKETPVIVLSVNVTGVLYVAVTEQPPVPGPVQLMLPPWPFTTLLVTVPPSTPARFTVNR